VCLVSVSRRGAEIGEAARDFPKTDKGWQAWLMNVRPPPERGWQSLGGSLRVRFPAVSVAEARRKLAEMRSVIREGRDPALEQRRARAGIETPRTLGALIDEYLKRRSGQVAAKTHKLEKDLLKGTLSHALGAR